MARSSARPGAGATELTFYDAFVPTLPPGDYELSIHQELVQVADPDAGIVPPQPRPPLAQTFRIAAARWRLGANDGPRPYPPAGGEGAYAQILPQLVLDARGLPWERALSFQGDGPRIPWVALLVFGDDELLVPGAGGGEPRPPTPAVLQTNPTLSETLPLGRIVMTEGLPGPPPGVRGPRIARDALGPAPQDTHCAAIDLPVETFRALLPAREDLPFLACSRQVGDAPQPADARRDSAWTATVIANRFALPPRADAPGAGDRPGRHNIVHLVSLEGFEDLLGETGPSAPAGCLAVRMVSLHSWSFRCRDEPGENFGALALDWLSPARVQGTELLLRQPGSLPRLSDPAGQEVRERLAGGYVALSYALRSGEHSFAWYRGPLAPVATRRAYSEGAGTALPFAAADAMVYEPLSGLFDLSQASAWSIGRALALADEGFALALVSWRRDCQRVVDLLHDRLDALGLLEDDGALRAAVDPARLRALAAPGQALARWRRLVCGALREQLASAASGGPGQPSPRASGPGEPTARPGRGRLRRAGPARLRRFQRSAAIVAFLAEHSGLTPAAAGGPARDEPTPSLDPDSLRTSVVDWLVDKVLLYGVPFPHLVPRAELLPLESLRFCYLDRNWTDALLDGCLSVGLQTSRDDELQLELRDAIIGAVDRAVAALCRGLADTPPEPADPSGPLAGFLLRSAVVRDWPGLVVRAWSAAAPHPGSDPPLPALRLERLSETVLLALYPEVPVRIELGEPAEALALGTTPAGVALRYLPGMDIPAHDQVGSTIESGDPPGPILVNPLAYRRERPRDDGVLIVGGPDGLAAAIQSSLPGWSGQLSAASFALQLVRPPETVVFVHPEVSPQEGSDDGS